MEPFRCVAVDDEQPALRVIDRYMSRIESCTLVRKFQNPLEAIDWIKNNPIHILMLDIAMPQMTGLDLIKKMVNPPVAIFTTAYSEFAADAFDLDAADYLLKPFSYDRFTRSIHKAIDLIQIKVSNFNNELESGSTAEYLIVKCDGKIVRVLINEIIYIQAYQEYICIYTTSNRYFIYERMKNIEKNLPPSRFLRVHRSYIVCLDKVKSYSGNLLEVEGFEVPISRSYKDEVFKKLL
ncbi:MAG: LytR/AlgR family response regulator transcription factor [Cyclobacteriaceae bacterium]